MSKRKKAELVAEAEKHNIVLKKGATKADIIEALAEFEMNDDAPEETETETETESGELSEYAANAEFREWWSGASKAERNAFNADRDPDSIKAPHSSIEKKPRTKIKRT